MTIGQISVNHRAVVNLAGRLEQLGYRGDDVHAVADHLARNLIADGYRPIQPPVPAQGPGASREAIEAARAATQAAVRAARERRLNPVTT